MLLWFVYATKSQRATAQSRAALQLHRSSRDKIAQKNRRCDIGLTIHIYGISTS